jgi:hypothetical protein
MQHNMVYPTIVIDCDGVLLDWVIGFDRWAMENGHLSPEDRMPDFASKLYFTERYGKASQEKKKTLVDLYNSSPAFATMPPCMGAIQAVKHLHETYGFTFDVVTSCVPANSVKLYTDTYNRDRARNLSYYFGPAIRSVTCLPLGDDKFLTFQDMMRIFPSDSKVFYIDDHAEMCRSALRAGMHAIRHRNRFPVYETDKTGTAWFGSTWEGIVDQIESYIANIDEQS